MSYCSRRDEGFGFRNVGFAEEELAIEVGQVDGVEIDLNVVSTSPRYRKLDELWVCGKSTHNFDVGEADED